MKKTRQRFFIFFILISGLWLSCQMFDWTTAQAANHKHFYKGEIIIGVAPWPGYISLYMADAKGYFKEAGSNVQVKPYPGLGELLKDYVAGKIQGRANLTLDTVNEYLGGFNQKIVLAIDYSNGSDKIVARRNIIAVKDFKGKRVAYELNTLEEFFLSWALAENNLQISDIISVPANPEEAAKLLKAGQADAAVFYEPFTSQYISSDEFHTVYSSANAPGLITDILTFREDFIKTYPETVQAVIYAYFKAMNFSKEHPEEANKLLAKVLDDEPESVAKQLKGLVLLDQHDNEIAFTFAAGLRSLYGNMRQIGKFVSKHHSEAPRFLDTDPLIDSQFI